MGSFPDNVVALGTTATALITFTNSRAVQLPCELDEISNRTFVIVPDPPILALPASKGLRARSST